MVRRHLLSAIVCTTSPVRADTRTWTDNTRKFAVEAELVEVKDGKAMLVVYSIGPDGQDDGGQLMVYEKMRGDFVFRLRR